MKRISFTGLMAGIAILISASFISAQHPSTGSPQMPMDAAHTPMVDTTPKPIAEIPKLDSAAGWFIIETRHRIFANFLQTDSVYFGQSFVLGEEEKDTAYVYAFNPDFSISDSGRVIQVSDSLINPAVHVRVVSNGRTQQESWAFNIGGSPHFRRNAYFAFRIVEYRVPDKYIKVPAAK
ncbi:MAG: hypothetical protein AB1644_07990 [Candidatus Zixiibacteriota bacterium]